MEIRDYLRVARQRWKLILGSVIAGVAVAVVITIQATPQYASTARIFVSTSNATSEDAAQGTGFSEQRVGSYADVLKSLDLSERVVDDLGLDISAQSLSEKIKAEVVPETVVLKITVTDSSPARAQEINTAVLTELQAVVTELETPPGRRVPLLKATVVESPSLPASPEAPRPLINYGLGALLGLLLGLGLALLRDLWDSSVTRIEDVPALGETPLLAGLAFDEEVKDKPLITSLESHAPRAEAFRVLRTNLSFVGVDHPTKAYVVTSSIPGEGKSTTAVNAAIAMASAGQRVLLVDGDLRRPQVASLLGLEGAVGLTTVLVGRADLSDAVQAHTPSGLNVLASGALPPNPAELLQSHAMHDLLAEARARYEVIIFDSPPLLPVTDAALMAAQTDGAILVVRHGKTTKDEVSDAVQRLRSVGSTPLGVVLNMIPVGRSERYGYGHGYEPEPGAVAGRKRDKVSR